MTFTSDMKPMGRNREEEYAMRAMFIAGATWIDQNPNLIPMIDHTTVDGKDAMVPINPAGRQLIGAIISPAPKSDYFMRNTVFTELVWYRQNGWDEYRRQRQRARYLSERAA